LLIIKSALIYIYKEGVLMTFMQEKMDEFRFLTYW